jgi:hypothetical protein
MKTLSRPRSLHALASDTQGQLMTEWVLVTAVVVMPLIMLVPTMLWMIDLYFYRIAKVVALPFP